MEASRTVVDTDPQLTLRFYQGMNPALMNKAERAMEEPEKYGNLIVRVGGFSARFVELAKDVQLDVLQRTLH